VLKDGKIVREIRVSMVVSSSVHVPLVVLQIPGSTHLFKRQYFGRRLVLKDSNSKGNKTGLGFGGCLFLCPCCAGSSVVTGLHSPLYWV
jgi:hypothetical protein